MMNKIIKCDLQLFADGGTGGGDAGSSVTEGGAVSADTSGQFAADTGAVTTESSEENDAAQDKAAAFRELVNGEYKNEAQNWFKERFGKRVKNKDAKIQEYDEYRGKISPVFEKLAVKYGVADATNIDAIMAAVEKDNSYYEEYAMKHNVTTEQAKALIQAERITQQNERRKQDEIQEQQFREKFNDWLTQAETLKQKYPGFDFEYESNNADTAQDFRRLLNNGVSVEDAYTVIHRDEIMSGAMAYTYQRAQQEMADNKRSRGSRPNENGTSSQQASAVTDDWSKLSRQDREKLNAAVSRGERVTPSNFRDFL